MVMGSRDSEEAGPSGVREIEENDDDDDLNMVYAEGGPHLGHNVFTSLEPMARFHPLGHSHRAQQPSLFSNIPQGQAFPLPRPSEMIQPQAHETVLNTRTTQVRIIWNHGGNQVSVLGSWDNWETSEVMQRRGREFMIIKTLPCGFYHYCFIVDGWLTCAPDLPSSSDDSGNAFNVLDLQERVSELPENLSEFEPPPSPPLSYDNPPLNGDDFSRPPPDLPPQLTSTVLNESPSPSIDGHHSLPRSHPTQLNHLYVHHNVGGQIMALGSTHKFRQKFVSMLLFRPLPRNPQ